MRDPRSFLGKLVGVCLTLLVAAAAVFIAVRLIEAVWTALVVLLGVGAFLLVAVFVLQARNRRW